mmetsp:Transcript_7441/g.13773  ORF Transcript_7441/g.13773 Transcript_7441/m.13773 type:complete len:210 (-) Transcript_7441:721-1350(-)
MTFTSLALQAARRSLVTILGFLRQVRLGIHVDAIVVPVRLVPQINLLQFVRGRARRARSASNLAAQPLPVRTQRHSIPVTLFHHLIRCVRRRDRQQDVILGSVLLPAAKSPSPFTKQVSANHVNDETKHHAKPGRRECPAVTQARPHGSNNKGRQKRSEIDGAVENRKGFVSQVVRLLLLVMVLVIASHQMPSSSPPPLTPVVDFPYSR